MQDSYVYSQLKDEPNVFASKNRKDLWSDEKDQAPEVRSKVVGLSAVGEICTSNRYSIIEEFGGFGSVVVSVFVL